MHHVVADRIKDVADTFWAVADIPHAIADKGEAAPDVRGGLPLVRDGSIRVRDERGDVRDGSRHVRDASSCVRDGVVDVRDGPERVRDGSPRVRDQDTWTQERPRPISGAASLASTTCQGCSFVLLLHVAPLRDPDRISVATAIGFAHDDGEGISLSRGDRSLPRLLFEAWRCASAPLWGLDGVRRLHLRTGWCAAPGPSVGRPCAGVGACGWKGANVNLGSGGLIHPPAPSARVSRGEAIAMPISFEDGRRAARLGAAREPSALDRDRCPPWCPSYGRWWVVEATGAEVVVDLYPIASAHANERASAARSERGTPPSPQKALRRPPPSPPRSRCARAPSS